MVLLATEDGIVLKDGIPVKTSISNSGYLKFQVNENGKYKNYNVHRIVAEQLVPNPKNLREVNHENHIKTDNRPVNLRWVSHRENINMMREHRGAHSRAKLNELQVRIILRSTDLRPKYLSKVFSVSRHTIHNIRSRKTWKEYVSER